MIVNATASPGDPPLHEPGSRETAFVLRGSVTLLIDGEPVFREAAEACNALLAPHLGFSVIEELRRDDASSRFLDTAVAQPAIFLTQVALAALWRAWGVTPAAVIGHSVGEVAAAYVSGALTLEEAARLVARRAAVMQRATGAGRMMIVDLPALAVESAIAADRARVAVGAVNGPASVMVAGDAAAIDALKAQVESQGVRCRLLSMPYAFHGPQMAALRADVCDALRDRSLAGCGGAVDRDNRDWALAH